MNQNLSMRQLRAFDAVAEAGSFTEAARALHLTQSALSVLVREMERALGVLLFDRSTRRVALTEAGHDLQPAVRRLLDDLEAAVSSVTDLRDKRRGVLRLAAPQLMACALVPRLIAAWRPLYPDVELRLVDTLPEQLLDSLASGEAEVAIGPDRGSQEDEVGAIARETLFRDRHWLACPEAHPLAQRRKVRWSALAGTPFIAPTRDFVRRIWPELHGPAGVAARAVLSPPAHVVSYITTALGLAASGQGVTVCPTYAAPLARAYGLAMVPLEAPVFYRDICLYRRAERTLSPAAASFADTARAFCAAQGGAP